ncbi:Sensory transduction protein LytR [termite gut metagenome]|uniref:Sensory transduction protein LytR n=1 Tax=termite gut metagenome TaxID=433724 RepID=A0A5J4T5E7_9ZZZZ
MAVHPLSGSVFLKIAYIAVASLATVMLGALLVLYGHITLFWAGVESITYVAFLALAGVLYGYIRYFLHTFYAKVMVTMVIQAGALSLVAGYLRAFDAELLPDFMATIPLCLVFGLLCWLSLVLWYGTQRLESGEEEFLETISGDKKEVCEVIDRISVKEGTRIHIIRIEELLHIEACGDYVMLVTADGEFVKEQTMKYYEMHLPTTFARIHRSYIINTNQVTRIELFGKDKYNVWLKNGTKVRASISGYRVLKRKLGI